MFKRILVPLDMTAEGQSILPEMKRLAAPDAKIWLLHVVPSVTPPPGIYPNTTFRDGIENTFAVGNHLDAQGHFPLYVAYEDFSTGVDNVLNKTVFSFGSEFVNFNALSPTATEEQRNAFLDSFLLATRTMRPRQIRVGLKFEF